nr:unnamed protein product [Spirometra erinaceieuropaei]
MNTLGISKLSERLRRHQQPTLREEPPASTAVLTTRQSSTVVAALRNNAYRDERPWIRIAYRMDGHLNQRWMHFQSRLSTTTVHELLFADDCALKIPSEEDMQRIIDLFSAACGSFGLVSNTERTVLMHQPQPSTAPPHDAPQISVSGTQPQVVNNFPLESSRSPTQHETEGVQDRHPPGAAVRSKDLDSVREAATPTQPPPPQLSSPHTEAEVAGPDPRYGCTETDVNPPHPRHVSTIKDSLKASLKRLRTNPVNWEDFVRVQPTWRRTSKTGAAVFESNCVTTAEANLEARPILTPPTLKRQRSTDPNLSPCQRTFRAPVGLIGHLRTNFITRATPPNVLPSTSASSPHRQSTLTSTAILFRHLNIRCGVSCTLIHCKRFWHTDRRQPRRLQHQRFKVGLWQSAPPCSPPPSHSARISASHSVDPLLGCARFVTSLCVPINAAPSLMRWLADNESERKAHAPAGVGVPQRRIRHNLPGETVHGKCLQSLCVHTFSTVNVVKLGPSFLVSDLGTSVSSTTPLSL